VLVNKKSIAALLVLAMVTVGGLVAGCGGLPSSAVAKVGKVLIDNTKFTAQVKDYATQYGISLETDPESYRLLAAGVLDSLVITELAVQKASTLGISVTDAEIQSRIATIVTDYYGGDQAALVTDLSTQSLTMDDLKKQVSDYLLSGLVRDQVVKDVAAPSDEQIAAYYETNKADYLTDQTIEARHILVAVGDRVIRGNPSPTTTESTTATTTPTDTSASTTTTGFSDLAWAKALATAAQIRAELLAGGNWSRLAAKYSADKPTKSSGGNLGTVLQGSLVDSLGQEFEDSLFALGANQISEPVKTANGYEVIQVTKITEARQKTLDEAKAEVTAAMLAEAQDKVWQAFVEKAKLEIGVTYREDMKPTTTTTQAPTTTTLAPATTTTTAGQTTTTATR
jgi:foldase protein PrsA